jgi:hypothetical protein
MRRTAIAILAVFAIVALGAGLSAREVQTVTGEVIDLNCYLKKGDAGHGEAHKECAIACAKRGEPLAILAPDGFYAIKGDWTKNKNEKLIEWIAQTVRATGEVREVNGKKLILLTDIEPAK